MNPMVAMSRFLTINALSLTLLEYQSDPTLGKRRADQINYGDPMSVCACVINAHFLVILDQPTLKKYY
jgi:hypothetical protein